LTVSVPVATSASSAASAKEICLSGLLSDDAASPSQSTSASLMPRRLAAAATSRRLRFSAALAAALPTMKVTRDEYEPLSLGVMAESLAMMRIRL
jgi:hypothetical protein